MAKRKLRHDSHFCGAMLKSVVVSQLSFGCHCAMAVLLKSAGLDLPLILFAPALMPQLRSF